MKLFDILVVAFLGLLLVSLKPAFASNSASDIHTQTLICLVKSPIDMDLELRSFGDNKEQAGVILYGMDGSSVFRYKTKVLENAELSASLEIAKGFVGELSAEGSELARGVLFIVKTKQDESIYQVQVTLPNLFVHGLCR